MSSFAAADTAVSGVASAAGSFLSSVPSPARLLVAVSGGSDSTGLLLALRAALATGRHPGLSILACTVDHGLRPESADEACAVAAMCARYGIEHHIRRWEGVKPLTGLSAASRETRYDLLAGIARETKAVAVLTGHTADDQRETIIMRQARGALEAAGTSGMAAKVLFDRSVWIMRPFLALARDDIRAFLRQSGEGWIDDPSNRNMASERARIRVGLAGGNLSPKGHGDDAAIDRKALAKAAADFTREHVSVHAAVEGDGTARFVPALVARIDLEGIGRALRDRAGWRAMTSLAAAMGGRVFPAGPVDGSPLRAFLESGILSRATFGRVVYDRRKDGLYIYRECRGIPPLTVEPGERRLWDGRYWVVNASRSPILVEASGSHRMPYGTVGNASVPDAVAKRAGRAAPSLNIPDGEPAGAVSLEAHLAPYDRFLPVFELELANALAPMFGREAFPPPFGG